LELILAVVSLVLYQKSRQKLMMSNGVGYRVSCKDYLPEEKAPLLVILLSNSLK